MSDDKRARLKQWLASGEARLQPLTFPQRELWEATPVPVGSAANHICCLIHLRGRLTPRDCERAMRSVVERQEVLRASFLPGKDGALQMIRKSGEPNISFRELPSAERAPEAIEARAQEVFREPFDLVQGPLYRVVVLQRGADDYVLAYATHHAIADGWTLGIFVQELGGAYVQALMGIRDPAALEPVPLTYSAWGAAERAFWQPAELEKRATFWKASLAGTRRVWSAPDGADFAEVLERSGTEISAELTGALKTLARRAGATLFSTLLAAFQIALSRWTGEEDIVVGTPVANRNKQNERETMGSFASVVPLRGQVVRDRPFAESLRATHQTAIDAFAHAMPFAELVRAVGDPPAPGHHPVFEVRFALQNHPVPDVTLPSLSARLRMCSTGTARFHLGCEITEDGEALAVVWLFRASLFSPDDIGELDRIFRETLAGVCRAPESRIAIH